MTVADGTTTLNSGIVSNGSLTLTKATLGLGDTSYIETLDATEATLALDTTDFEVVNNQIQDLSLTTTGSVNDALNGDVDALRAKISGETKRLKKLGPMGKSSNEERSYGHESYRR